MLSDDNFGMVGNRFDEEGYIREAHVHSIARYSEVDRYRSERLHRCIGHKVMVARRKVHPRLGSAPHKRRFLFSFGPFLYQGSLTYSCERDCTFFLFSFASI